jgi:hypothetical protein
LVVVRHLPPPPIPPVHFEIRNSAAMERLFRDFPVKGRAALASVLNETARHARGKAATFLARELGVKRGDLIAKKRNYRYGSLALMPPAKPEHLSTGFVVIGKRIPLFRFGAKPQKPTRPGPRGGVSYKIGSRGRRRIKDAFIAAGRRGRTGTVETAGTSGHLGVFKRVGRKRIPIMQLFGPSIPHVADKNPGFADGLRTNVAPFMKKRIIGRLKWLWEQAGVDPLRASVAAEQLMSSD